jgi:hypothetical protein
MKKFIPIALVIFIVAYWLGLAVGEHKSSPTVNSFNRDSYNLGCMSTVVAIETLIHTRIVLNPQDIIPASWTVYQAATNLANLPHPVTTNR